MELSEQYIKGFNSGYILRKNHPVLAKNIINGSRGKSKYLKGLKAGAKQYEIDLEPKLKAFQKERMEQKSRKDKGLEI
jgi:hypothetical protein